MQVPMIVMPMAQPAATQPHAVGKKRPRKKRHKRGRVSSTSTDTCINRFRQQQQQQQRQQQSQLPSSSHQVHPSSSHSCPAAMQPEFKAAGDEVRPEDDTEKSSADTTEPEDNTEESNDVATPDGEAKPEDITEKSSDGEADDEAESDDKSQEGLVGSARKDSSEDKAGEHIKKEEDHRATDNGEATSDSEHVCEANPVRRRLTQKTYVPQIEREVLLEAFQASKRPQVPDECAHFTESMVCDPSTAAKITEILAKDMNEGGQANAAWPALLMAAFPEFQDVPLPSMLAALVTRTQRNRKKYVGLLRKCIELFAGKARLTYAHLERALEVCTRWDDNYGESQNCTCPVGLRSWLNDMSLADEGALIWLATQCSSWLQMCVTGSQRRLANEFMGDLSKDWVQDGNAQMVASALIYFLAWLTNCAPVLEQPTQSVLPKAKPFATVLAYTQAWRTVTWHGAFNGESSKPLQLWHVDPQYARMKRNKPAESRTTLTTYTVSRSGRKGFTGKSKELKASQAYTLEFGRAVAAITSARFGPQC